MGSHRATVSRTNRRDAKLSARPDRVTPRVGAAPEVFPRTIAGRRRRRPTVAVALPAMLRCVLSLALSIVIGCAHSRAPAPVSPSSPATPMTPVVADVGPAAPSESPRPSGRPWRDALREGRVALRLEGFVPARGATEPLVDAVLFGDFTDPTSATIAAAFERARLRWPDDVRVRFVHVPMPTRPMARLDATAAIEAGRSDRFWPMVDRLFADPPADRAALARAAGELGIGADALAAALDGDAHRDWIDADLARARALGIARPGVGFVNGRAVPVGADAIVELIEDERDDMAELVRQGLPRVEIGAEILAVAATPSPLSAPSPTDAVDPAVNYAVPARGAPVLGPLDAPVTIVIFADFQCPFCARVQATLATLRERHGDELRIVYRNLPLAFHTEARNLAKLALAVRALSGRKGPRAADAKFFAFHDLLFARKELGAANWRPFAKRLGLDPKRVAKAATAPAIEAQIAEDERDAAAFGARGTPSFFVNGRPLQGAQPIEAFETLIAEELAKARDFASNDPGGAGTFYDRLIVGFAAAPRG
ncbi:MAG: thioredoxin domain-containing protein [Nannocystaceae bacterium]|nr:thioredoxin domain-containing protein [Nannocystaceae bacterium]